ncbi:MAG: hypothetical protein KDK10_18580 [Maritimibacter sp.]|nr:hypothetical protein [Maritimibacter sp.]
MIDLYIDSAETSAWAALMPTGLFCGITTNPLLAQRAGLSYPAIDWGQMARRAADLGARELHAQVAGPVAGWVDFAQALYDHGRAAGLQAVVKVPLSEAGIRAVPAIRALGGRVLMTAAYDAKQMFVATGLGADYIAPYFGRMLERGLPAYEALGQMRAIGLASGAPTRILVASLRDTGQMVRLAAEGQDCFTLAPGVAQALLSDPHTVAAVEEFEAAAAS